ncbi:glycosyltransferase, partial [Acinetobacter baumannii]
MEENSLLISVVIPMYNSANTIVKALDSVKNQSYICNYEVLVVNDGSVDESQHIVE